MPKFAGDFFTKARLGCVCGGGGGGGGEIILKDHLYETLMFVE